MKKVFSFILPAFVLLSSVIYAQPQHLDFATPEKMGMDSERLSYVDTIMNNAVRDKDIPGGVVAVVRGDKIVYLKAFGNKSVYPKVEKMTTNTVFDLASCSKSVGTTMSFMQLFEKGKVRLTDPVSRFIPGFEPYVDENGRKIQITIQDLLTHTSGLPAYVNPSVIIEKYGTADPDSLIHWIAHCKREFAPKSAFQYSCLNFITLQNVLQNITGERLCDYAQKNVFDKLGMAHTTYSPKMQNKKEIMALVAPTEKQPDGKCLLGEVHDPLARVVNKGNSGNAGVFSSTEDLALLAAALMNGGEYGGRRILGPQTIKMMTRVPDNVKKFGRSLGWDNYSGYASYNGNTSTPYVTFGHSGYTGTSISIDPATKTAVIILAHRVHPTDGGGTVRNSCMIANIVYSSIVSYDIK
ncbi:MAG: serine hydrolase domain-containing protein [Candidatus Egerieousia sp.]